MANLSDRVASAKSRGRDLVESWRVRRPWIDRLIRTVQRYHVQSGDRLAGAVTYFAFLSFFPLIALAFAVAGYVLSADEAARQTLEAAIKGQLPGLADRIDLEGIARAKATAGIIGLVGLLYSGLGAIDALREALRQMSMTTTQPPNFFLAKLRDLSSLVMIGLALVVSVLVGGFATQATTRVSEFLGLGSAWVATASLWLVGLLASLAADWVVFLIVLGWVARPTQPFRVIARGALIGAIGFGVLKQVATLLLSRTLTNPLYGTFAVMVGLLIWINLSARLVLYVASWTATAGLGPPPSPSPVPSSGASGEDAAPSGLSAAEP